jgi:hypothetical protein
MALQASARRARLRLLVGLRVARGREEAIDAPISKVRLSSTPSPLAWAGRASLAAGSTGLVIEPDLDRLDDAVEWHL